jgi:hypothetical protein
MTNANDLHQLPENHPVSQRERISLSHIDTPRIFRKHMQKIDAKKAKADKRNSVAADGFVVGQSVRTRKGELGQVVAISGGVISIEIGGAVHKFVASMVSAA